MREVGEDWGDVVLELGGLDVSLWFKLWRFVWRGRGENGDGRWSILFYVSFGLILWFVVFDIVVLICGGGMWNVDDDKSMGVLVLHVSRVDE